MKRTIAAFLTIIFFLIIGLPSMIVWGSITENERSGLLLPKNKKAAVKERSITLKQGNKLIRLDLDEYLQGVIAGEMPAGFALEALKAQAIAARTYALKQTAYGSKAISSDFKSSQAWISEAEMKKRWGADYPVNRERIRQAVLATKGEVLFYQGELINAYYHSTCGGRTASSEEVFGQRLPYLEGVECRWDKKSLRYHDAKTLSLAAVQEKLKLSGSGVSLKVVKRTKSGRIAEIKINDKSFTGREIRSLLGLRSAAFTWKTEEGKITFYTTGYGHGVGLCQFGANGLAKEGRDAHTILRHYYPGCEIVRLK